jgi:hypothetical protein
LIPKWFRKFRNVRFILDCTEIRADSPHALSKRKQMYSSYKTDNTMKCLIGVSANGTVIFVSSLYGGSATDNHIFRDCGIRDLLVDGETIMADKGFRIQQELPKGINLITPPFLIKNANGVKQFTVNQAKQCLEVSRARSHVERIMHRIKLYKFLLHMNRNNFELSTQVFQVCAALVNWQAPVFAVKNLIRRTEAAN